MNTHEYQAKEILKEYGVPVPEFRVIEKAEDVDHAIEALGVEEGVVKVQVHAGGRGKAGGVKLARSLSEIRQYAKELLGLKIVNNQTGPQGVVAEKVLITPLTDIQKEFYLAVVIDRQSASAVMIASPEGGVEIEEVAEKSPEKILKIPLGLDGKIRSYKLIELAKFMGWKKETAKEGMKLAKNLAKAFMETDASLFEINPLAETAEGRLFALDAKLSVDDNALFRQPHLASFYDPTQLPKEEEMANRHELAYVALDGEIGCMVNGAGLAMATMDLIFQHGGKPANFLDVGGGASEDKVAEGFKIVLSDEKVKAILVNIFGGIMNCATLAGGILAAAKDHGVDVPLVVRMEGTNVEEGRKMLADSGLDIIVADDLTAAAEKVVEKAKEIQNRKS